MNIEKSVSVIQNKTIGYKCDCCGKETHDIENEPFIEIYYVEHDIYDNDTQFEYYHACSIECWVEVIKKILKENSEEVYGVECEIDGKPLSFYHKLIDYIEHK